MKSKNLQIFGAVLASIVMVFSAGFYSRDVVDIKNNSNQTAQVYKYNSKDFKVVQEGSTDTLNTLTSSGSIAKNPVWKKIQTLTGGPYVEIPSESLNAVTNFCGQLEALNYRNGTTKLAAQMNDGKYYCIGNADVVGGLCGNGTASSCQSSGCCGSCIGGVLPPGVGSIDDLPGLVFIPSALFNTAKDSLR